MRRVIQENQPYPLTETMLETASPPAKVEGIVVAKFAGFDPSGSPQVEVPGYGSVTAARSTVSLTPSDQGRDVALMFENGDWNKPIVLGLIHQPVPVEVAVDKKRLVLDAEEEIVLRCGKSSITLTKAGKVLIRGDYLLSRSSGVNRIKGGSVQIN